MKNALTRILAILLALLMLLGMAACSKSGSKESLGAPGGSTQPEQAPGQTSGEPENAETDGSMESDMLAEDQTLGYYVGNDPGTIDPWVNNSGSASTIIAAVNEPMFRYADNEQGYEPGIMTDYMASEDNTVHTLTLREGAKWEDGTEITMDDVTNSILRAIDPELGSSIAYRYFIIKNASEYFSGEASVEDVGVKALDAHTLEITTAEPCDYFLDLLTSDAMAPIQKMAADKYGELALDKAGGTVFISHGDCRADADTLAAILKERYGASVKEIVVVGPVIGAHSGPGTLALFFLGEHR